MAGAYCQFCNHRCFVLRRLPNGQELHVATCLRGAAYDRERTGYDFQTSTNPSDIAVDPVILSSAVRYGLGRSSYIVHVIVTNVIAAWPNLTEGTREVIRRDVKDAVDAGRVGSDADRQEWVRLLAATELTVGAGTPRS
ncbi:hypothetical protein [Microbacterium gorillae]|uniref:hypothetical protein n=1 Tax=Microbacterium gorillae TaxID=1231063 RepID=UPI003D99CD10